MTKECYSVEVHGNETCDVKKSDWRRLKCRFRMHDKPQGIEAAVWL